MTSADIPLELLTEALDRCPHTDWTRAIRRGILTFGEEGEALHMYARDLSLPTLWTREDYLIVEAFRAYALCRSGWLLNGAARRHQRGNFDRAVKKLLTFRIT